MRDGIFNFFFTNERFGKYNDFIYGQTRDANVKFIILLLILKEILINVFPDTKLIELPISKILYFVRLYFISI